jgi:hypothetical protein
MPQLSVARSLLLYLRRSVAIALLTLLLVGFMPLNLHGQVANMSASAADAITNNRKALNGITSGYVWLEAPPAEKLDYCNRAFAAFRSSPAQSYVISSNVQSLSPAGLCDRIEQFFSLEDNLETRLGEAAAIAPLLYADTPLGTMYNLTKEVED